MNGFIALVFGAFALSLLGAFEITLPSGMLTKLDQRFAPRRLPGHAADGPDVLADIVRLRRTFVGSLLVSSVQSKGSQPVLGMVLSPPASRRRSSSSRRFPSYLKKLPKSGGWLVRVKVVMGFVLLALHAQVPEQHRSGAAIGWLTRERFLAAWFVLFAMPACTARSAAPGRNRSRRSARASDACSSPRSSDFRVQPAARHVRRAAGRAGRLCSRGHRRHSGETAAAAERQARVDEEPVSRRRSIRRAPENKLVLVTFTGYACTNCQWMKAKCSRARRSPDAVKDLVLVELYTDGTDEASEENGKLEEDRSSASRHTLTTRCSTRDEKYVATFGDRATDPRSSSHF